MFGLLGILRRRSLIFVATALTVCSAVTAFSLTAEKQYSATSKLLFRDPGFDQSLFGAPVLAPSPDAAREAATNIVLVSLDDVAARASRKLGEDGPTVAEIRSKIDVMAQGQSNVVAVTATDASPALAARLANTITREYIVFRREADRSKIRQALSLARGRLGALSVVQRTSRERSTLRRQIEQLTLLASLRTGNAEVIQTAETPSSPSSPQPVRNGIVGFVLGLLAGFGLAVLRDRMDRRLRDRAEVEEIFGRPVLGVIPESRAIGSGKGTTLDVAGVEGDAFRMLRMNLRYFDVDRDVHVLLITSAAPGEGKSTVARYLAATATTATARAILIEADLRRPTLNQRFAQLGPRGLTDALCGQASLRDVIQQIPLEIPGVPPGERMLDVIVAGSTAPNPTDLLESDRMREVLAQAGELYDLVIIDSPPVALVPDTVPLAREGVSSVLVVVREAKSTRTAAVRLRARLDNLGVHPLGIVVNGAAAGSDPDGYEYYAYPEAAATNNGADGNGRRAPERAVRVARS